MIYVARVFSGIQSNADIAEEWTAYLNLKIEGAVFLCPWLPMVRHWVNSGDTRARGMHLDISCAQQFDGVIALSEVTGGVAEEWKAAKNSLYIDTVAYSSTEKFPTVYLEQIQEWVNSIASSPQLAEAESDALGRMIAKFLALYYQAKDSPTRDDGEMLEMKVALDAMRDYRSKSERVDMCDEISLIAQEWSTGWHNIEGDVETATCMRRICDVIGTTYGGDNGTVDWKSLAKTLNEENLRLRDALNARVADATESDSVAKGSQKSAKPALSFSCNVDSDWQLALENFSKKIEKINRIISGLPTVTELHEHGRNPDDVFAEHCALQEIKLTVNGVEFSTIESSVTEPEGA